MRMISMAAWISSISIKSLPDMRSKAYTPILRETRLPWVERV